MDANCYICGLEKAGSRCVRCKKNVCGSHYSYIESRVICDFCGAGELRELEEKVRAVEKEMSQKKTELERLCRKRDAIDSPRSPDSQSAAIRQYAGAGFGAVAFLIVLLALLEWSAGVDFKLAHYLLVNGAAVAILLALTALAIKKRAEARSSQHRAVAESITETEGLLAGLELARQDHEKIISQKKAEIARLTLE